jgi:hypothetical protein
VQILRPLRFLGALAILAVGAIHLQQYFGEDYHAIPTIGPLFLLNGIGSAIVGLALLLPIERVGAARKAQAAIGGLAAVAVVIAVGSLIALFISENASLFGFREPGYRAAVVIAIAAEGATVVLLGPLAAIAFARARGGRSLQGRRQPSGSRYVSGHRGPV